MRPVSSLCLWGLFVSPTGAKEERRHARRRQDTTKRNWRSNNNVRTLGVVFCFGAMSTGELSRFPKRSCRALYSRPMDSSSRPNPLHNSAFPAFATGITEQFIVLGDSTSDSGRRFDAPASFDFEDIGPYPWARLFEDPDSEVSILPNIAYHRHGGGRCYLAII